MTAVCPMSVAKQGSKNPNWNGGKTITSRGYVKVLCKDHPYSDRYGYVYEHRVVMENHIGRYLDKSEVVHHINHVRTDNRIENLRLHSKHGDHIKNEHGKHGKYLVCATCGDSFYRMPSRATKYAVCSRKCINPNLWVRGGAI